MLDNTAFTLTFWNGPSLMLPAAMLLKLLHIIKWQKVSVILLQRNYRSEYCGWFWVCMHCMLPRLLYRSHWLHLDSKVLWSIKRNCGNAEARFREWIALKNPSQVWQRTAYMFLYSALRPCFYSNRQQVGITFHILTGTCRFCFMYHRKL